MIFNEVLRCWGLELARGRAYVLVGLPGGKQGWWPCWACRSEEGLFGRL